MNKLVQINLHGDLGEQIGQSWKLAVKSVSEAIHAINILSKKRLYKYFYLKDQQNIRYKIVVNNEEFKPTEEIKNGNIEAIKSSELALTRELKTIDIVPVIEGGDKGIVTAVLGAVLIIVGIVLVATGVGGPLGAALIIGGIGLLAAGIMTMLSQPPTFEDFRASSAPNAKQASYLFNGPVNTITEGGPVPLGYGRLIVGSQVISTTYEVTEKDYEAVRDGSDD